MAKNLLIVESPAKAKTIEKYLGKDFVVKSSYGHIRDLDKGNKGIDIDNNFTPSYVVSPEKIKVVRELKAQVDKVSEVWLATDEDREGEAISWHLCEELGLNPKTTKRIVFSEITKQAITRAVEQPRLLDLNLVNAQQARRILDRLVGFELSEVLWRKVKNKLSAGRVQSVAVRLVVEREREINNFEITSFFKVSAFFDVLNAKGESVILKAELGTRLPDEDKAYAFLSQCQSAIFKINGIEKKPLKRYPAAPFTTSTLQQEASRKMGFSVNRTMSAAQRLYEEGHITYMRTDSTNLSETAIHAIADEIKASFGNEYLHTRRYKSKSANAQEAHEAIRPTYMDRRELKSDNSDMARLYDLIYKRTIASQMSPAEIEKTVVKIAISTLPQHTFEATGEVILFDGFLRVYIESTDDDDEDVKGMLPPLKNGQTLQLTEMQAVQSFTRPPARYTEASLVKKLEEEGIGRPSTYAPTITKIMEVERGYVVKESREGSPRDYTLLTMVQGKPVSVHNKSENFGATKNCLYPTDIGLLVTDFLTNHFEQVMDYKFTAEVEAQLDKIATEGMDWKKMLKDFYFPFHDVIENTLESADRVRGRRELGEDPETGYLVLAQMTRYGPVIQIGDKDELPENAKPKFANLKPGQSLETITLEEALKLFDLPKTLGEFEGLDVIINNGRYGPYIKLGEIFINIPKGQDIMSIDLNQAITLIKDKRKEDAPIGQYQSIPITKGKGRFGPFVKWGDLYVNIPVRYKLETITEEQAIELIEAKIEKENNRYIQVWPEEKISIENGRWGPYIKFGKLNIKIPKVDGQKVESSTLQNIELSIVKQWIAAEVPNAFDTSSKQKKK